MTDTFTPLPHVNALAQKPATATASEIKLLAETPDKAAFDTFLAKSTDPSHSPDPCANPSVTLRRDGDVVTGIRVQCGCGRVLELNCVY